VVAELDTSRVTTGVSALDEVLDGGVPRGSIVFVTGLPGAGKTILCEQMLFANGMTSPSVLYVTTLSEPPVKMLRYTKNFGFFRSDLLERTVHYADIGSALRSGGPEGAVAELETLLKEHRPSFLVLDSFKVFREHFESNKEFRAFASDAMLLLTTWEVTSFLVGEYSLDDVVQQPEFAIADGILHLSGTDEALRQKRYLNVIKMRGADAFLGRHYFEIDESGINLYPRMLPRIQNDGPFSSERIGSAIEGMNELMSGGVRVGSTILVSGGSGSGKTITAMSFGVEAARSGLPVLYVTFEEAPDALMQNCAALGWDLNDEVDRRLFTVLHVAPAELDIDRHAVQIKDAVERLKARLVVIDSVTAFEAVAQGNALRDYIWGLSEHLKRGGITLILTAEAYSFFEQGIGFDQRVSYIADTLILCRLVEEGDRLMRKINVLKMRGSGHDRNLHELRIGPNISVDLGR
jgi:circadian clock protein KaiC